MNDATVIEAGAQAMWASDPRVNQSKWSDGDVQLKDLYRIMAAAARNACLKQSAR